MKLTPSMRRSLINLLNRFKIYRSHAIAILNAHSLLDRASNQTWADQRGNSPVKAM